MILWKAKLDLMISALRAKRATSSEHALQRVPYLLLVYDAPHEVPWLHVDILGDAVGSARRGSPNQYTGIRIANPVPEHRAFSASHQRSKHLQYFGLLHLGVLLSGLFHESGFCTSKMGTSRFSGR